MAQNRPLWITQASEILVPSFTLRARVIGRFSTDLPGVRELQDAWNVGTRFRDHRFPDYVEHLRNWAYFSEVQKQQRIAKPLQFIRAIKTNMILAPHALESAPDSLELLRGLMRNYGHSWKSLKEDLETWEGRIRTLPREKIPEESPDESLTARMGNISLADQTISKGKSLSQHLESLEALIKKTQIEEVAGNY